MPFLPLVRFRASLSLPLSFSLSFASPFQNPHSPHSYSCRFTSGLAHPLTPRKSPPLLTVLFSFFSFVSLFSFFLLGFWFFCTFFFDFFVLWAGYPSDLALSLSGVSWHFWCFFSFWPFVAHFLSLFLFFVSILDFSHIHTQPHTLSISFARAHARFWCWEKSFSLAGCCTSADVCCMTCLYRMYRLRRLVGRALGLWDLFHTGGKRFGYSAVRVAHTQGNARFLSFSLSLYLSLLTTPYTP